MNYYSDDIFSIDIGYAVYSFDEKKRTESLYSVCSDGSTLYYYKSQPYLSGWLSLLDYNEPDEPSTKEAVKLINKAYYCFDYVHRIGPRIEPEEYFINPPKPEDDPHNVTTYWKRISKEDFSDTRKKIFKLLQKAFTMKPALGFLYPYYVNLMRTQKELYENGFSACEKKHLTLTSIQDIEFDLRKFQRLEKAKRDIHAILMRPAEMGLHIHPTKVIDMYQNYAHEYADMDNDFLDLTSGNGTLVIAGENALSPDIHTWDDYLQEASQLSHNESFPAYIFTLDEFLRSAFDRLVSDESQLRKCKLCGRYFRARYSTMQEYCSRKYKNTATTCYEYASRKSYAEKKKEHPIHSEFMRAYHTLYGRIRRNKLSADSPLMAELKAQHEAYYERYENAELNVQKKILDEYIAKNNELLS